MRVIEEKIKPSQLFFKERSRKLSDSFKKLNIERKLCGQENYTRTVRRKRSSQRTI